MPGVFASGPSSMYLQAPGADGQQSTAPVPSGFWTELDMYYRSGLAVGFFEDFLLFAEGNPGETTVDQWAPGWRSNTEATDGLFTRVAATGGGIGLSCETADNDHVVAEMYAKPFSFDANDSVFAFECCFKVASIADTKNDLFIGVGDTMTISGTVPITATAGTLASEKLLGFHRNATDGDMLAIVHADAAAPTVLDADFATLVAGTYVRAGWMIDRRKNSTMNFYLDGVKQATTLDVESASNVPEDALMGLVIAQVAAAASGGVNTIAWIKAIQKMPGVILF